MTDAHDNAASAYRPITTHRRNDGHGRSLEFEAEVAGTPEEVWQAIATGPGISSWYVPHTVDERQGGRMTASFGPGPEMTVEGRVAAWEQGKRVMFDGGDTPGDGPASLAFEWLVEAEDGGSCVVRLVNSGFGDGDEWDAWYDGMSGGWIMFLRNLQLHLAHFPGRTATPALADGHWPVAKAAAWDRLTTGLGLPSDVQRGDRVSIGAGETPTLTGTVTDVDTWRLALLLDGPAPGTAFLAAEGPEDGPAQLSVWCYLYSDSAAGLAAEVDAEFRAWMAAAIDT